MKFIVDAQLPPRLADLLNAAGHDATHLFHILPIDATDLDVATEANRRGAIVISKDEDFAQLSARRVLLTQFLWIRSGNMTALRLWQILEPLLPKIEQAFAAGERIVEIR